MNGNNNCNKLGVCTILSKSIFSEKPSKLENLTTYRWICGVDANVTKTEGIWGSKIKKFGNTVGQPNGLIPLV